MNKNYLLYKTPKWPIVFTRKITILFLSLFLFANISFGQTNETEPNNTWDKANKMTLNTKIKGNIDPAGDVDWFKVTTTDDGKLTFTITPLTGKYINIQLFDTAGVISLNNKTLISSTFDFATDGLAAGTYYAKVTCYYGTDTESYEVTPTLLKANVANDKEPNNSPSKAVTLNENKTITGHVGYYYNNERDTTDWYKITTTKDGRLDLKLTTENGNYINIYLYDANGSTKISEKSTISPSGTLSTDGLAAGTYYIKIACYFNTQFTPYTLTDSLFPPVQANDLELNNNPATALNLSENATVTGHVGYYNNNYRDTTDWYKITTSKDGRLDLKLTTENGNYINIYLYDADGSTKISEKNTISPSGTLSTDGLAAGNYYIKIACYYNSQFAPYTLTDSLFSPAQANDKEPNNNPQTAIPLSLNKTVTGHVGYYNDNKRDTTDYYKIMLPQDGQLDLTITTHNGQYINMYLFDKDGNTVINSRTTISPGSKLITDGLAAGTYYVKIACYYNSGFTPYTLTDSLKLYKYAADTLAEPNKYPYEAKTLLSNRETTGHIGFYQDIKRDTTDWWKINYTGSGDLKITLKFEPNINNNNIPYYNFAIYKDTAGSPIVSKTTQSSPQAVISLSNLSQQYYYIKINAYYSSEFFAYSIADTFTQVNIGKIVVLNTIKSNECNKNSLSYTLSNSHSPYMVRLYRDGKIYDSATTSIATVQFSNLPVGIYYATVYGDGASGEAFVKSDNTTFLPPVPQKLTTTNISLVAATLNWNALPCVSDYSLQFRLSGNITWTTMAIKNNTQGKYDLTNLIGDTTYIWRIASVDSTGKLMSDYSDTAKFFTKSGLPVTLIVFSAQYQPSQKNVLVSWKTATEQNNKGFELQRSNDGNNFIQISFVDGAGNSSSINSYQFTDTKPLIGQSFYRLNQVDMDGKSSLSPIVPVLINSNVMLSFSPNPVKSQITVKCSTIVEMITLFNLQGQQIKQWKDVSPGKILNLSQITSGVYLIKAILDGEMHTFKIVKE